MVEDFQPFEITGANWPSFAAVKKDCSYCNLIDPGLNFQGDPFLSPEVAEAGVSESGLRNAGLDFPTDSSIVTYCTSQVYEVVYDF